MLVAVTVAVFRAELAGLAVMVPLDEDDGERMTAAAAVLVAVAAVDLDEASEEGLDTRILVDTVVEVVEMADTVNVPRVPSATGVSEVGAGTSEVS